MNDVLAWALHGARQQTLALVRDVSEEQRCLQSVPDEHHPAWILGHLLLGDVYLLSLLGADALPQDFTLLLRTYGPGAASTKSIDQYDPKHVLADRLARTGFVRCDAVRRMSLEDLAQPTPDEMLARTQPTIGHHLHALLFHEGHHEGQLTAWRTAHGLPSVRWNLAP